MRAARGNAKLHSGSGAMPTVPLGCPPWAAVGGLLPPLAEWQAGLFQAALQTRFSASMQQLRCCPELGLTAADLLAVDGLLPLL